MSDPIPFRRPVRWENLGADEAERIVREWAADTVRVTIGVHAFDRIAERTIVTDDVYRILRTGTIRDAPEREGDDWKVIVLKRLQGTRDAGIVTIIIRSDQTLFVKTVQWMDCL